MIKVLITLTFVFGLTLATVNNGVTQNDAATLDANSVNSMLSQIFSGTPKNLI
jgi:hypothetical protein